MARQKGLLKIEGTLDNLTFYKTKDGNLVRTKGGISKERMATDPNFRRTRENGSEFGMAASSGKLVRDATRNLMMSASDGRVTSRLTKVMTDIKALDSSSIRGLRSVAEGIATGDGKQLLKGFNFNNRAIMGAILFKPYSLDNTTGNVTINDLIPINDIAFPQGATHVSLKAAWSKVNFETRVFNTAISNISNLPINGSSSNVTLTIATPPTGTNAIDVYLLSIEFFQEVNGVQYSLRNGAYNSLVVTEVLG